MAEVITYHARPIELEIGGETFNSYWAIPTSFHLEEDQPPLTFEDKDSVPEDFVELDEIDYEDACRELALRLHLDDWSSSITVDTEGRVSVYRSEEWWVLTDSEADDRWEEDLRNYLDDVLEIPNSIRPYLDEARWLDDAKSEGDRGHGLATYDGNEYEVEIDDEGVYYLFRTS